MNLTNDRSGPFLDVQNAWHQKELTTVDVLILRSFLSISFNFHDSLVLIGGEEI